MKESDRVRVERLQPIQSRGWVVASVADDRWDLGAAGLVDVSSASGQVQMRLAGYGEAAGQRLLTLLPLEDETRSVREIVAALGGVYPADAFIQRVSSGYKRTLAQAGARTG